MFLAVRTRTHPHAKSAERVGLTGTTNVILNPGAEGPYEGWQRRFCIEECVGCMQ